MFRSSLVDECRDAARSLIRARRSTFLASACLAIGLGASAVMFGVVDALFLRPPAGVQSPERVTRLYFEEHANGGHEVTLDLTSYAVFKGIRDAAPAAQVAAYYRTLISEGAGAQAVKLQAGLATADFFRVLGVSVPVGRGFLAQDAQVGAPLVAIVSHDLWQQRFGGQKNVLGVLPRRLRTSPSRTCQCGR